MSFDGPFLEHYDALALRLYRNAKRGIACICEGLYFLGKMIGDLFLIVVFTSGLCFAFLISLPFRLLLYLFDYMKPDPPDTLPRFEPRPKDL